MKKLGYKFNDENLLYNALTHSSYANEKGMDKKLNNERLEFLGDAVLELAVSQIIYEKYPEKEEGEMTLIRSIVVQENALHEVALDIDLDKHIRLSTGEERNDGFLKPSILSAAVEAIIGAVYIDGGYDAAKKFVNNKFNDMICKSADTEKKLDSKSELQVKLQEKGPSNIEYIVEKEYGPEHDKVFHVNVYVDGSVIGKGTGKNKKSAEQNAAREALKSVL